MPSSPSKAKPHMHRRFSLQRHTPQRNGYGNVTMSWYAHTTDTARRCSSFENLYCVVADGCWRVVDRNYNTICCTCPRVSGSRTSTCLLSLLQSWFLLRKRGQWTAYEKNSSTAFALMTFAVGLSGFAYSGYPPTAVDM